MSIARDGSGPPGPAVPAGPGRGGTRSLRRPARPDHLGGGPGPGGRRRGDPADLACRAADQRVPGRRGAPAADARSRRCPRRPRWSSSGSGCRASWRRMTCLPMDRRADPDDRGRSWRRRSRPGRCPRPRSPTRTWPGSARWTTSCTRSCTSRRTRRGPRRARWTTARGGRGARAAGRRAAGAQGRVHHHGHAHHLRVPHPGRLAAALRRDRDPAAPPGRGGHPGQGQHGRVRHGLVHRELGVRAVAATRGT